MTEPNEQPDAEQVRPFADYLIELEGGKFHTQLSQAMHALNLAVRDNGKKGAIQITLSLEPISKTDSETLKVTPTLVTKTPKPEPKSTIFFVNGDGNLTRDQPGQLHLPLREVPTPTPGEIRKVN